MRVDQVTVPRTASAFQIASPNCCRALFLSELHEERLRKLFTKSNAMNRQFDVDRSDLAQNFERSTRILRRDKNGYVRLEQRSAKFASPVS